MNDKQTEALLHNDGPLLILAGAGSGKTRVLTHKIARLINDFEVKPSSILAITFTNKAAAEMKERTLALLPEDFDPRSLWISTFHSVCVKILRRHADKLGFKSSFNIYDADDSKSVVSDIMKKSDSALDKKEVRATISVLKNYNYSAEDILYKTDEVRGLFVGSLTDYCPLQELNQVMTEYQQRLKDANAMDFDDLLIHVLDLFQSFPKVLAYYQNQFQYVLVDEYQDTNRPQFELIRLLTDKPNPNICVVGDDDQSIYKFRGADISNILSFEKQFANTTVIKLEQNYRSSGNIVKAAASVIVNNSARKDKTLWTEQDSGAPIHVEVLDNQKDEAALIAAKIKEQVKCPDTTYSDTAILYRNNFMSRSLEDALIRERIPYKIIGGIGFYQRMEVKDLLSYLRLISSPDDVVAFKRVANVPKRGIGKGIIFSLNEKAEQNGLSPWGLYQNVDPDFWNLNRASTAKLLGFFGLIETLQTTCKGLDSVEATLIEIDKVTGYTDKLENSIDSKDDDRLGNVMELFVKAKEFDRDYDDGNVEIDENMSRIDTFLANTCLGTEEKAIGEGCDFVSLMTIHSAKGLEFKNLFIAAFEDSIIPSYFAFANKEELEEERRLTYVAITRAKETLCITRAKSRFLYGRAIQNDPSRFLSEVPREYLDLKGSA